MNANVLILGATSDIALAVAKAYAEKKHTIILAGRATEKLEILRSDITIRYSATVYTARFDAADTHDKHQQFYNSLPVRPDIIVCAFGYLGDQAIAQSQWSESEKDNRCQLYRCGIDTQHRGKRSRATQNRHHHRHKLSGRRSRPAKQLPIRQRQSWLYSLSFRLAKPPVPRRCTRIDR